MSAESFDVLPDRPDLACFKRALLELADAGLRDLHDLSHFYLRQMLRLSDIREAVCLELGKSASSMLSDLGLIDQAARDGLLAYLSPVLHHDDRSPVRARHVPFTFCRPPWALIVLFLLIF